MTRAIVAAVVFGALIGAAGIGPSTPPAARGPADWHTPAAEGAADRHAPAPRGAAPPAARGPGPRPSPAAQGDRSPATPPSRSAPVAVYHVWVRTGTAWRAGTNARVHIEIRGAAATGIIRLDTPRHDDFGRGNVRRYETPPLRLGEPLSFSLTSDGSGLGADWLVEYVCIGTDPDPEVSCTEENRAWVNEWVRGRSATLSIDLPRRR